MELNASQFGNLYHGSAADLQVGDRINPRPAGTPGNHGTDAWDHGHTFATPHLEEAKMYAEHAARAVWARGDFRASPRVYSVRPTGPVEQDPAYEAGDSYRTRHPLQVTGRQDHNPPGLEDARMSAIMRSVRRK